jgi:hypothetical protein
MPRLRWPMPPTRLASSPRPVRPGSVDVPRPARAWSRSAAATRARRRPTAPRIPSAAGPPDRPPTFGRGTGTAPSGRTRDRPTPSPARTSSRSFISEAASAQVASMANRAESSRSPPASGTCARTEMRGQSSRQSLSQARTYGSLPSLPSASTTERRNRPTRRPKTRSSRPVTWVGTCPRSRRNFSRPGARVLLRCHRFPR